MTGARKTVNKVVLRKQCLGYLGELGRYIFLEFSALAHPRTLRKAPVVDGEHLQPGASMLLRWMQAAIPRTSRVSGLKILISKWGKIQRGYIDHTRESLGLEFVTSSTMLANAELRRNWGLILIYERKTQSLFHYIVDVGSAAEITSELIWFSISRAAKVMEKSGKGRSLLPEKKTVLFPSCLLGSPINNAFREASNLFEEGKRNEKLLKVIWRDKHEETVDTGEWEQGWYIGRPHLKIHLEMNKVNDLRIQMGEVASDVSKYFREYQQSKCSNAPTSKDTPKPSWVGLNAPRAKDRKAPDRFDQ